MEYTILQNYGTKVLIRCNTCGFVFDYSKENVYKFKHSEANGSHCLSALHNYISTAFGPEIDKGLFSKIRGAKNRATNPRNKDYAKYHNLGWGYDSLFSCVLDLLPLYVEATKQYTGERLSIDRIDGSKGYCSGNIRFVPMAINLQNKAAVKPVLCKDIVTGIESVWQTTGECERATGVPYNRIWEHCNMPEPTTYKNRYIFRYLQGSGSNDYRKGATLTE